MATIICNVSDSFVANPQKLRANKGSGEASLYIGQELNKNKFRDFFSDFTKDNEYFFSKKNFENYMQDSFHEYKQQNQIYRKNIFLDYDKKCKIIKNLNNEVSFKNLEELIHGKRFYIRPKHQSKNHPWTFIRNILLPIISQIHIQKKPDGNKYRYEFKLSINYKEHSKFLDPHNINLNNYIEEEIKQKHGINNLTTKRLIEARIGQGYFKKKLFERSNFCLITGIKNNLYLEAAHIKPWSRSNDYEKLDPKNGILLTPNCHKLFDRGMITFSNNGKLIKSTKIKNDILDILLIENKKVDRSILLDTQTNKYLDWHRENIYEKL